MSSYKTVIGLSLLLFGCSVKSPTNLTFQNEDRYILLALESERIGDYNSSIIYLDSLYKGTEKIEYEIKRLYLLNRLGKYKDTQTLATELLSSDGLSKSNLINIYKLLIISYINTDSYDKALINAKELFKYDDDIETIYSLSLMQKDYKSAIEFLLLAYDNSKVDINKIVDALYIYLSDILNHKIDGTYDDVLTLSEKLLSRAKNERLYELMYSINLIKRDYKSAFIYIDSLYAMKQSEDALNKLVNLLYLYLNDKDKAISYLETHSRLKGCSEDICNKLISLYAEKQDIDGVISIYKRMYKEINREAYAKKIVELFIFNKNLPAAIAFLEKNRFDDELLFNVYKMSQNYSKAKELADEIYKNSGDINYLAQSAMIEYEVSTNRDKKLLRRVAKKLKYVNSKLDNDVYQNYLGYLLIEHNIDVKNGIKLVKKALKKNPKSPYYLDSLAWGYYKLNECSRALELMREVVDMVGLDEDEVKEHLEAIKRCKTRGEK